MLKRTLLLLSVSLVLLLAFRLTGAQDEAVPDDVPYKDATLSPEERTADLLARMTIEEKIGQLTLVEKNSIQVDDITTQFIGGLLSGGGGYPQPNTPEAWADMVDGFQNYALKTRLAIPIIYGVDAVHGHTNVYGATIFPHNVGMGATRDPELVEKICRATAIEMIATGIYWDYAPVVAVPQDIRWGRTYEGYSENTELVTTLSSACISGLQGDGLGIPGSVLATAKHFVGDGGTAWGSSTSADYMIDQGDTQVDEATLREIHLPPYQAAVGDGVMSIMASFSSWNGLKMHAQGPLLTNVLKDEFGFQGFIVSDWQAIDQIPGGLHNAVVTAYNAGIDMNMVPYNYDTFISTMLTAVSAGEIPMERIDDAVRRILLTKFQMGLFEHPFADRSLLPQVGSDEHRALARQAVAESAVLLQNEEATLPLAKDTPTIFVAGRSARNVGIQSGGWTLEWQGVDSNTVPGTNILDAITAAVSPDTQVFYNGGANFDDVLDASGAPLVADVGILVLGETPYAEGRGDRSDLSLTTGDYRVLEKFRARVNKLVLVIISGRPLIISDALWDTDAAVAAWLPGSEGAGIADVLFGDQPFVGKTPYTWPRSMDQLPFDFANLATEGCDAPLFPYGYGLSTDDTVSLELLDCPA